MMNNIFTFIDNWSKNFNNYEREISQYIYSFPDWIWGFADVDLIRRFIAEERENPEIELDGLTPSSLQLTLRYPGYHDDDITYETCLDINRLKNFAERIRDNKIKYSSNYKEERIEKLRREISQYKVRIDLLNKQIEGLEKNDDDKRNEGSFENI